MSESLRLNYDIIIKQFPLMALLVVLAFIPQIGGSISAQVLDNDQGSQGFGSRDNPPLRVPTAFGTYTVELQWKPESIGIENETVFTVRILDSSGGHLSSPINYDFTVAGADLAPISELQNQTTDGSGVGKPISVQFENEGPVEITVWVNPSGDNQSESATFNLGVTPEFPIAALILVLAGPMVGVLVLDKLGKLYNSRTI